MASALFSTLGAQTPHREVGRQSKVIVREAKSPDQLNLHLEAPVYWVEYEVESLLTTWIDWICENDRSPLREGDWNEFFEVPRRLKAERLARSIKGLSFTEANQIVQENQFFKTKPLSWADFKAEISRADDFLNQKGSLYTSVIRLAGTENRERLNYTHSGVCRSVEIREPIAFRRESREQIDSIPRDIRIDFINSTLFSFEFEKFEAIFDGQMVSLEPLETLHSYSITSSGENDYFRATAADRKPQNVEPTSFSVELVLTSETARVNLRDLMYWELVEIGESPWVEVSFEIEEIRSAWFNKKIASGKFEFRQEYESVDLSRYSSKSISLERGHRYRALFWFQRRGSKLFKDGKSRVFRSSVLKIF